MTASVPRIGPDTIGGAAASREPDRTWHRDAKRRHPVFSIRRTVSKTHCIAPRPCSDGDLPVAAGKAPREVRDETPTPDRHRRGRHRPRSVRRPRRRGRTVPVADQAPAQLDAGRHHRGPGHDDLCGITRRRECVGGRHSHRRRARARAAWGGAAAGVEYEAEANRLWVAGVSLATVRVYDASSGELLRHYSFAMQLRSFINDLVVTDDAVYATDSFNRMAQRDPAGRGRSLPDQGSSPRCR